MYHYLMAGKLISIHAPTRGATEFRSNNLQAETISIHAPTRGATAFSIPPPKSEKFQSTLLQEERRDRFEWMCTGSRFQSTLLQEERLHARFLCCVLAEFQSTLLQEERQSRHLRSIALQLFQSTLLQEERRQKCTIILILICNNYCIVSIKSHQHYNNYFM